MTLRTDRQQDLGQPPTRQEFEAEYRRMLAYQTVDELRAIADRWGIELSAFARSGSGDPDQIRFREDVRKDRIVEQLAAWLSDPQAVRAYILELDELGQQVLAYLHLILAPEYGLAADNIVQGFATKGERFSRFAGDAASYHGPTRNVAHTKRGAATKRGASAIAAPRGRGPHGTWDGHGTWGIEPRRRALQEQIATLSQRGLLLPFTQNNAVYYALPAVVRACLPPQPDLFPAYAKEAEPFHDALCVHERTIGSLIQTLFAVWEALAKGIPWREQPPHRQAAPPRQPIEDQWPALRGWDHVPSEIAVLSRVGHSRGRSSPSREDRLSTATLNWAVTIPAPAYRLCDADRQFLREQTGCSDPEIEFYYILLAGIGAIAADAGQPIAIHKEAMQRFLRLAPAAKVRTLWQAWSQTGLSENEVWSEMDTVLRSAADAETDVQHPLRLRRSLAHANYKAADLYREWRSGRQAVLRFLSLLPEDRWTSVSGFTAAVFQVHPNLLHAHTDPSVWWLESLRTGKQFGTTLDDWQQSYGRFVVAVLEGPLAWLGLVRLGYRDETLEAFQLTSAGLFALGRRSTLAAGPARKGGRPHAATEREVSIADDLTVTLVPDRVPSELHDLLHSVAKLLDATPERFVYRVTADRVFAWVDSAQAGAGKAAATEREAAVEMLIATLDKYCRAPDTQAHLPAPWQGKLRAWSRNYGKLHVYENMTLIELADDYALQELLINTSLREHLLYQFSPRLVAIKADAADALVHEMEKCGYTPRVE